MHETTEIYGLLLAVFLPMAIACLPPVLRKFPRTRDMALVLGAFATFLANLGLLWDLQHGKTVTAVLLVPVHNVPIAFTADPLGLLFALLASFLWMVTNLYSIHYMPENKERHLARFNIFFAVAIGCVLGIAYAANLFTMFIFYELLTLTTYPLVVHSGTAEAKRAGKLYLATLIGTSITFFALAIFWTWAVAGTADFTVNGILAGKATPMVGATLLLLFIFGIAKTAIMPLHRWLPAAMVAPVPVSALLHAVAVVKAGAFCVLKIVLFIFGTEYLSNLIDQSWWLGGWVMYLAGVSVILAGFQALKQDNLKRRLAYSTVSQLSYIVMAAAIASPKSLLAAAFHIVAHGLAKITLFFTAGAIATAAHKKNVNELNGLGWVMPWTMGCFTIAALSMIGLPGTVGFLTKWYMLEGAFDREALFAVGVIMVSTLLNCAYFLPIVYGAFFRSRPKLPKWKEAPLLMVVAPVITTTGIILLFFSPGMFLHLAEWAAGL